MSLLDEHDSSDLTSTSRHRCDFGVRMTTPSGADRRTQHHEQDFSIAWAVIGLDASQARAAGEVDLATAPLLVKTLRTALDKTRLVLLDLQEISFMDASGLHVLVDVTRDARRAGRRLVVSRAAPCVRDLLMLTDTERLLDVLAVPSAVASVSAPPPANPVNARVMPARVMAVSQAQLWLHGEDGSVQRAWAPRGHEALRSPGRPIELFVDADGETNGWRDPISGLAVNQRRSDRTSAPTTSAPVACQGRCGLVWQAPAAAALLEHEEHCLACWGPLAPG